MNVAIMKTKAEQALSEHFEAAEGTLPGGAVVQAERRAALGRFSALGLPHRRVEEWKYTDLRAILKDASPLPVADAGKPTIADVIVALGPLAHIDASRAIFIDGAYRADISDTADLAGLDIEPLSAVLALADGEIARALLATTAPDDDAVAALNTAYVSDGAIVRVAAAAKAAKPLLLVFVRASRTASLVTTRNIIKIGANAAVTIVEAHVTLPGAAIDGQDNTLTEISVGDGAEVSHIKIAAGAKKVAHLANWLIALGRDATYKAFQYTADIGLARNQIFATYHGEGTKLDISGAFLGRDGDHIDTTLVVDHAVPKCQSRELFRGVLDGHARGIFQGKIIVRPDAQKTDGKQMAQVLMLSPDAEFDAKPELEIYADDVVCGHGATSAELDADLMFYCQSRGIPATQARALLTQSFVGEAIEKIEDEAIRAAVMAYADMWLARMPAPAGSALL